MQDRFSRFMTSQHSANVGYSRLWTLAIIVTLALTGWGLARPSNAVATDDTKVRARVSRPIPNGSSSDETAELANVSGPKLMRQIVLACQDQASVSAKVRHQSHLFGQKLVGSGSYLQRKTERGLQVHFVLTAKAYERNLQLVQVNDGRYYWTNDNLENRPKLRRADLARLRRDAELMEVPKTPVLYGGGIVTLLASLEQSFVIARPQPVTFQQVPMWALAMRWKPQRLQELFPKSELFDEDGKLRLQQLPPQFPDRVFLLVGQDDLFPYRVDFRRTEEYPRWEEQAPTKSVATMELFEVRFGAAIDPMKFKYQPPKDIRPENLTEKYLLELQAKARKSTAARPQKQPSRG